jgi:hypothetical protein
MRWALTVMGARHAPENARFDVIFRLTPAQPAGELRDLR